MEVRLLAEAAGRDAGVGRLRAAAVDVPSQVAGEGAPLADRGGVAALVPAVPREDLARLVAPQVPNLHPGEATSHHWCTACPASA